MYPAREPFLPLPSHRRLRALFAPLPRLTNTQLSLMGSGRREREAVQESRGCCGCLLQELQGLRAHTHTQVLTHTGAHTVTCMNTHTHAYTDTHTHSFSHTGAHTYRYSHNCQLGDGRGSSNRHVQLTHLLVKPQTRFQDSDFLSHICSMSSRVCITGI